MIKHNLKTFLAACCLPQVRTLYWAFVALVVALLVAYTLEIVCWLILGAVVNPSKYLPYSVAAITLLLHSQVTYARWVAEQIGPACAFW